MKYGTSVRARHLVGRFDKGEELIGALEQLCARERVRAGVFQAFGVLAAVELQEFLPDSKEYSSFFRADRPMELLSLTGNVSLFGSKPIVHASAQLCYLIDGQLRVVGGHLARGRVHVCEFSLTAYDDLKLERQYDPATGLPLWGRPQQLQPTGGWAPSQSGVGIVAPSADAMPSSVSVSVEAPAPTPAPEADDDDAPPSPWHVAESRKEPEVIRRRSSSKIKQPDPEPEPEPAKATRASKSSKKSKATPAPPAAWNAAIGQLEAQTAARRSAPSPVVDPADWDDDDEDWIEEDFEDYLSRGSILQHPNLGRCTVMRIEDDESVSIRFRRDNGRNVNRKLNLTIFKMRLIDGDGDQNVFALELKRARDKR